MGMRQLGAPGEALGLTPERTPRHSIPWTCRSLSAALPYWRGHEGLGPAATSDRYGRFLGRRPLLCPVLGSAPASGRSSGRCPLPPAPPGASTAAPPTGNGTPVPRPQVDCKGDGWWEKIALWARVMPSIRRKGRTRCGPHRRVASHAKVEAAASKTAGCRPSVAGTLLTEESGYDLR